MACQPILGYFMLTGFGITFIVLHNYIFCVVVSLEFLVVFYLFIYLFI